MMYIFLATVMILSILIPIAIWRRRDVTPYEDERMTLLEIKRKHENYLLWGSIGLDSYHNLKKKEGKPSTTSRNFLL